MTARQREEAAVRERIERECHALDRRTLLAAAIAMISGARAAQAQRMEQAGSVGEIKGEAFAEARRERRVLGLAAPLFIDDVVGTGEDSRLTLHLGRDTTLRLGQKARLTIDRLLVDAGGEITLQAGPILFDRRAGSSPSPTRIKSAYGLIAVRGTRFFAGPSADVFGVFVERGNVAVSAAGREVLLQSGQGTNIPRPGDTPTPPAVWGAARVRAALASVE
jgi:ferric-dicitrate binding protein FerR (iron transport regulator)